MARSLNQCSFIGNLGRDPETRYLPSGGAVTNFTIAVSDDYKDKTGQMVEQTEWVRLVAYGKLAEVCGEYLKKGSKVFVQGKMKTRKYQDRATGQDRYSTEVQIENMQMLDSRQGGGGQGGGFGSGQQDAGGYDEFGAGPSGHAGQRQAPASGGDFDDSDIPF